MSDKLTDADITGLKRLLAKASKRPWLLRKIADGMVSNGKGHITEFWECDRYMDGDRETNAALTVDAINALPKLLAERVEQAAEIKRLKLERDSWRDRSSMFTDSTAKAAGHILKAYDEIKQAIETPLVEGDNEQEEET